MNATRKAVVGVDKAKSVVQLYTVEQETGEVINKPIKRAVPAVVRQSGPVPGRHGGMRGLTALGAPTPEDGA